MDIVLSFPLDLHIYSRQTCKAVYNPPLTFHRVGGFLVFDVVEDIGACDNYLPETQPPKVLVNAIYRQYPLRELIRVRVVRILNLDGIEIIISFRLYSLLSVVLVLVGLGL